MVSENRAGSCMLFEYDCFSTCAPQYLVPAGHYLVDYLLFIPLLLV